MKTKTLDAVEIKRQGSIKIYEATAQMTREQQLAFWQQRTAALKQRKQATQRRRRST